MGRRRHPIPALALVLLAAAALPAVAATNPRTGRVFIFSGATGLPIRTITSPVSQHKARFGASLAGLGDINGDGVPDLAVGAPRADAAGVERAGSVHLISGADGSSIRTLAPPSPAARMKFGWSLAAAGDLDSDGAADLLVGAPRARVPGSGRPGEAYLFSGGTGILLAVLRQPSPGRKASFGISVAAGADATGDGLPDLVVGAPRERVGKRQAQGRVYLFDPNGLSLAVLDNPRPQRKALFGRSVALVPDIDGDGSFEVAAGADGQHAGPGDFSGALFLLNPAAPGGPAVLGLGRGSPPAPQANFGFALAGLEDLDGDGAGDLVAAAPDQDTSRPVAGAVFTLGGASPDPNRPLASPLDLLAELFDPEPVRFALFGAAVAALPDLTGDGRPEVIVGSELHKNSAGIRTGRAYVYDAAAGSLLFTVASPTGDSCSRFGWSVAGAGDVDGDGTGDFAVGAPRHRSSVKQKAGRCF